MALIRITEDPHQSAENKMAAAEQLIRIVKMRDQRSGKRDREKLKAMKEARKEQARLRIERKKLKAGEPKRAEPSVATENNALGV
jgi:hypothetical protein